MKKLLSAALICFALINIGCDDVIIPDISDKCPVLVVPADSLQTTQMNHNFVWDGTEFSDEQRLTIFRIVDGAITVEVLDTFVNDTRFTHTFLETGEYDWEVTSLNEAYQSQTKFRTIFINDSEVVIDISNDIVDLLVPEDQICTNLATINFSWSEISGINQYEFQLGNQGFTNLLVTENINGSNILIDTPVDGIYQWRVRGVDSASGSQTAWTTREISIDKTAPVSPFLLSPTQGDTLDLNTNINFSWSDDTDELNYQFFLFADQNQDTLVFQQIVEENSFSTNNSGLILNPSADYFWRVTATDKVGNVSDLGPVSKFIVR